MSKLFYEKEFPSTTAAVAETLGETLNVLAAEGWIHPDNTFCIRLCLEEALVNAVVHGNENEPGRSVCIRMYQQGDTCTVCVYDEGEGFDVESVKMSDCRQKGGRGVCLIKEFMEEVRFNVEANCLEMVFNRRTFSEACA